MGYMKFEGTFPQGYPQFLWIKKMCYFYYMSHHITWQKFIELETKKNYFKALKMRLVSDSSKEKLVLTKPNDFFRAFTVCELDKIKVVIVGQDPYHTPGVANGLAFSVNKGSKIPPSLKNIFKELRADLGIESMHGDLISWARQGVFLLNTSLSVCAGKAASHSNIGWEKFTDKAISLVQNKKNIIFLLWGNQARKKRSLISSDNFVFEASHPSPLSAHIGFHGCRHFSKTNAKLIELGLDPIDWRLE